MSELDTAFNSIAKENGQDGADFFNLVTKVVLPEEVKDDVCNQSQYRVQAFHSICKGTDRDWQRKSMVIYEKNRSCSHGKPQERRPRCMLTTKRWSYKIGASLLE